MPKTSSINIRMNISNKLNLDKLNKKLKTVRIGRISKFEKKGTYSYDVIKNEILFSSNRLVDDYDLDHLFMKAILEMTASTDKYTGFKSDEKLRALNEAYTEILANYLIGNEGISDLEEEIVVTNLISVIPEYSFSDDILMLSSNDTKISAEGILNKILADKKVMQEKIISSIPVKIVLFSVIFLILTLLIIILGPKYLG